MSTTLSMYVNRVTVSLTSRQRDYLYAGMRRQGVGLSEYMRRVLDKFLELEDAGKVTRP
jgi:hypothetical protein